MKKIVTIFIIIALALVVTINKAYAQLHISLGHCIGYTIPSGDFGGASTDFYGGTKYGLSPGINFGAMGKVALGPLNFRLALLYSPLSNSGVSDANHPNSSVSYKRNLFEIAIGTQYGFGAPLVPIKPYIGLDLLITTISGSTTFQGTQNVPSGSYDMNSATRTGLGIAAGAEITLLTFSLDFSIRYNMINLFNKRYEGSLTGNRIDSYTFLNDDKDPNYSSADEKHPIGSSRTIATIQFQLGVMFGF